MDVAAQDICEFGGFRLDVMRGQLTNADGAVVPLMPKAVATLAHLVAHAGRTVHKDELIQAVWPDTVVEENNLSQNISALRKALGEKAGEHRYIVTVPGHGYRFVAPVRAAVRAAGVGRAAGTAPGDTVRQPEPALARPTAPPLSPAASRRGVPTAAVVAILGLAVAGIAWFVTSRQAAEPAALQTVAVLPFKPVLDGQRNEAMELGIADSLITELSRSTQLIVRPLTATRRFTEADRDPIEVGRRLRVDAVVDGTLQVADGRLRVSARLLRVADGRQLWAGKFDERLAGVFAVQDALSQRVAAALQIRLSPGTHHETDNLRAYELYMHGRLHRLRLVMPEVRRGIDYYERAILEDPSYALAHAGLAGAMLPLVLSSDVPPADVAPRAKIAALRAIELAPDLPEANYARGTIAFFFDWDWQTAEDALRRAVELAPNDAEAHVYLAHLYSNLGRKDQALRHARRARELDPVSPLIGALEGQFLGHQGEHDAAIERLNEVILLEPRFWLGHHLLANALIDVGRYQDALAASAEAKRLSPLQTYSDAFDAISLAGLGRTDEARAILATLTQRAHERYVPPTHRALIHAALGENDAAFEQLEAALAVRDVRLAFLKIDPKWNPLRGDARFAELLRRVGF